MLTTRSQGLGHEALVTLGWFPGDSQPSVQQLRIDGQITDISDRLTDSFLGNITSFTDDNLAAEIAETFKNLDTPPTSDVIKSVLESSNPDDIYKDLTYNGGPLYVSSIEDRSIDDEILRNEIKIQIRGYLKDKIGLKPLTCVEIVRI